MKYLIIYLFFLFLIEGTKLIYYHYTLISTPFKGQTINVSSNHDVTINYSKGQNVLIIFEPYKNVYLSSYNIHIYQNNLTGKKQFNYIIQRDGINCAFFIYDIDKNLTSSSFYFKNIEKNFEFKLIIQQNNSLEIDNKKNDIVMLASTTFDYFGDRKYLEIICYLNKQSEKNNKLFITVEKNKDVLSSSEILDKNKHEHQLNYYEKKLEISDLIEKELEITFKCMENDNKAKEIIITNFDLTVDNLISKEKSKFYTKDFYLIIVSIVFLVIILCFKFILPIYKIIKEKCKKQEQNVSTSVTNFFLNNNLTEKLNTSFDYYTKSKQNICDAQYIYTETDLRITYVLIKFPHQTNSIYLINNLTLDASVSFWKFAYSKKIELIITLAPCFNYTNTKNSNDHFYEYAPGYFPEFIFDMIVSMKEKQNTDFTGIHLRDFEVNKLDITKGDQNDAKTMSILQLYVVNWKLNNNFPSLFYISHILSTIESLECETLLIHGTCLGRRADILVAIIILNKEIIKKIENGEELNEKILEETLIFFESITKSNKFNKFEYNIMIISLIAHLVKKGYIQNKVFEKNLKEYFQKLINENKLSNI